MRSRSRDRRPGRDQQGTARVADSRELAELGQCDFGENYLQEALPKLAALADLPLHWHFTGQIQSNKTRADCGALRMGPHSGSRTHRYPAERATAAPCTASQYMYPGHGSRTNRARAVSRLSEVLVARARDRELPRLRLRGLMCIPPPRETFEEQSRRFERCAACSSDLNARRLRARHAVDGDVRGSRSRDRRGATWVRIGTAIFGERLSPAIRCAGCSPSNCNDRFNS